MLVIDYFNFLYARYPIITEEIVLRNLKLLGLFVDGKNIFIKVVFDGIYFQEIIFCHTQISLLFSYQEDADAVIKRVFSKLQGKSHILVSKDRALCQTIKCMSKSTIITPEVFWQKLDLLVKFTDKAKKKTTLIKTTDYEDTDLDVLFKKYHKIKK